MNLYKIMLVDDEEEARKSIVSKIDWEKAGYDFVGDAENGQDAMEKIEALEPNVIITDIHMPYMSGLELAKWVQQKYPSIKVIILSGYSQFEYAQEAMRYGVKEYILKPIDVEALNDVLTRVRDSLNEEIEARKNIAMLMENYNASLPTLREQFLNKLIRNSNHYHLDREEIETKIKRFELDLLGARKWTCAVVDIEIDKIDVLGELTGDRELIPISVRKLLEEKITVYCRNAIFSSALDSRIVIIFAIDETNTQTGLMDVLRDVCRESLRTLGVPITMGFGDSKTDILNIEESYNAAVDAIGYKRVIGIGGVIYIQDVEPVNVGILKCDEKEENDIISVIKFGPEERIKEVVENIYQKMTSTRVHVRQSKAYMFSIVACVVNLMQQYEINTDAMSDYSYIISRLNNVKDFKEWLIEICKDLNSRIQLKRETTTKQIIKEAKEYINHNYQNPALSVEIICKHLHMSPAYFSTLFKKEMSQTYVAYLTDLRLNKAVELLNTTDYKTYVIAEMVGYQEQNYFSYVFKKKFGIPPTKYRVATFKQVHPRKI